MPASNSTMAHSSSILLVIDIQQRLAPAIRGIDGIVTRNAALIAASERLDVPVVFTEQYPAGLGHTDPRLLELAPNAAVHEKIHFGAAAEAGFTDLIGGLGRHDIVVTGTEAHICVLQTAMGLAALGYNIRFCVDAVGSRTDTDKAIAVERAREAGLSLVTAEMVLFEWLERADTEAFRALLPNIRSLAAADAC